MHLKLTTPLPSVTESLCLLDSGTRQAQRIQVWNYCFLQKFVWKDCHAMQTTHNINHQV